MNTNKIKLRVNQLKPGMVVAEEILVDNVALITPGIVLNDIIINKLKEKYFQDKVVVYSEENVIRPKTVEEIERSFSEFSFDVEEIFQNMDNKIKVDLEEVKNFTKKIQEDLNSPSAVIKNIVLYGSGNDAIYRHSVNVTALSSILGNWIGFDEKQIKLLTYAAILHDFGKTKIDKHILETRGVLTSEEKQKIRSHSILGYNLLKQVPYLNNSISFGVLMHHERLDGSGYPLGLKGNNVHPFAKVIAIADVFDAANSERGYKKREYPFEALETIQKDSLGKLDYEYCKIFIDHIINYYIGEKVVLNTGNVCKIVQIDVNELSRPLLLDNEDFIDLKKEKNLYIKKLVV